MRPTPLTLSLSAGSPWRACGERPGVRHVTSIPAPKQPGLRRTFLLVQPEASSHPICRSLAGELASDKLY